MPPKKKITPKATAASDASFIIDTGENPGSLGASRSIPKTALSNKFKSLREALLSGNVAHEREFKKNALAKLKAEDVRKLFRCKDEFGQTLAQYASVCKNDKLAAKALKLILTPEYGCNVNVLNEQGHTPFQAALLCGNSDTACVILESAGFNFELKDGERSFLFDIIDTNNPDLLNRMLDFIREKNGDDYLKELLCKKDEQGHNILQYSLKTSEGRCKKGEDLLVNDLAKQGFMFNEAEQRRLFQEDYFENLAKIANLLLSKDRNLLYDDVLFDANDVNLFELVEEVLKREEFKSKACVLQQEYDCSPFVHAIRCNSARSVEVYISSGAVSVEAVNEEHEYTAPSGEKYIVSPLQVACMHNIAETQAVGSPIIKSLIRMGAEIKDGVDYGDFGELLKEISLTFSELKLLGQISADKKVFLEHARNFAKNGNELLLRACIIDHNLDVNEIDEPGSDAAPDMANKSLLCCAIEGGQRQIVKFLVEKGANVNSVNGIGESQGTILAFAFFNGDVAIVDFLIEYGAVLTEKEKTELLFAMVRNPYCNLDLINLIMQQGCDMRATNEGRNALCEAIYHSNSGAIVALIAFDIDLTLPENQAALDIAVDKGNYLIADLLLMFGLKVNNATTYGKIMNCGDEEMIHSFRLFNDEIPGYICKDGSTVLYKLINYEAVSFERIKEFIDKGCNINSKDKNGHNILEYFLVNRLSEAKPERTQAVIDFFIREGIEVDTILKNEAIPIKDRQIVKEINDKFNKEISAQQAKIKEEQERQEAEKLRQERARQKEIEQVQKAQQARLAKISRQEEKRAAELRQKEQEELARQEQLRKEELRRKEQEELAKQEEARRKAEAEAQRQAELEAKAEAQRQEQLRKEQEELVKQEEELRIKQEQELQQARRLKESSPPYYLSQDGYLKQIITYTQRFLQSTLTRQDPKDLNILSIFLKGSAVYRSYTPNPEAYRVGDIDLEIKMELPFSKETDDEKVKENILEIFNLTNLEGEIQIYRAGGVIKNIEFRSNYDDPKKPPFNIIIRHPQEETFELKCDWMTNVDALRIAIYDPKNEVKEIGGEKRLTLSSEIYGNQNPETIAQHVEKIRKGILEVNKEYSAPMNVRRIKKHTDLGFTLLPSTSPFSPASNLTRGGIEK